MYVMPDFQACCEKTHITKAKTKENCPYTKQAISSQNTVSKLSIKEGKGKDVDLYSASHAPGTSNAHLRH